MADKLARVRAASASLSAAQVEREAAIRDAITDHTLAEIGEAAGLTRGRVSQIVGPTGRSPGRRSKPLRERGSNDVPTPAEPA